MTGGGLEAHLVVDRPGGFRLDADLVVAPRRTVALLGPNGAGKSTVVAALAGLLALDGGAITLDGRVLDAPGDGVFVAPSERRVGVVHQDLLLFPHLDVAANVAFGLRSRGMRRSAAEARAKEWLDRLDLAGLGDRRPEQLSGGQAQRVALARALATEPDLLLLDEPLSALDATGRVAMRRVLAEHLDAFAGPRVVITHDPVEAFVLADDVVVLEDGRVTQVGTPDEIRRRPLTRYAADLVGLNLVAGTSAGDGRLDTGAFRLVVADPMSPGEVLATIHPRSVAFHRSEPSGSARNTWSTIVLAVEDLGDRVRLVVGDPLPLVGEVTHGAIADLDLRPGGGVWVSVKATEIRVGEAG